MEYARGKKNSINYDDAQMFKNLFSLPQGDIIPSQTNQQFPFGSTQQLEPSLDNLIGGDNDLVQESQRSGEKMMSRMLGADSLYFNNGLLDSVPQ